MNTTPQKYNFPYAIIIPLIALPVIAFITILFIVILPIFKFFYSDTRIDADPSEVSAICSNLGKITGHIEYSGDKPYYFNMIQYLEKNDGKKILLGEYESGWGGDNSKIYNQLQNRGSTLGQFPLNKTLQKPFTTIHPQNVNAEFVRTNSEADSVIDKANTTEAVYIHPDTLTESEFKTLTDCVTKASHDGLKYTQNYNFKNQKTLNYMYNPRIFVYSKPDYFRNNNYLAVLECKNNAYSIYVEPSSKITLRANDPEAEIATIGKVQSDGLVLRETDYKKVISSFYGKKTKEVFGQKITDRYHYLITSEGIDFNKAYNESETLKLLFNEKQEPVNDFLNTCKTKEGKTIFELYKN